jgi:transposase
VPREAGQQNQRAARAARPPHLYDHVFDTVRVRTAYRCRAYPGEQQQQVLNRTFGCVRLVWNQSLAARHARWQTERKSTSCAQTDAALTIMKKDPDLAFLNEVSSVPLQQALRHQQRLARGRKGSANRAKATAKVARAHRAISDCGWGEFRRQLEYKCERYGRELVVIGRWYPSSKTCSACGHRLAELSLGTRQWTCPSCGARHDRDINAPTNILAAGQAVTACGAGVSHPGTSRVRPAVKQEPQPVTAGIPVPLRAGSSQRASSFVSRSRVMFSSSARTTVRSAS